MSLQIDEALREGFQRTVARNGLILVGVFVVFGLVNAVIGQSLSAQSIELADQFGDQAIQQPGANPFGPGSGGATPFALPIPLPVAGLLTFLTIFVAEALKIVGIRVFAGEDTETISGTTVKRRIVLATLNGVVGGLIVAILTALGLILLVVPGIYIAISFFFVRQEIAVADKNFVDALGDSWSLTEGNRWELLGLAIIVVVINFVASSPTLVLFFLSQEVASVVSVVVSAATTVFGMAVATRAYVQVRDGGEAASTAGGPSDGVDDDWDDPDGVDDEWSDDDGTDDEWGTRDD